MEPANLVVDTNIIIEYLRNKNKKATVLNSLSEEITLCLSAVSLYELHIGAPTEEKQADIRQIADNFVILPLI